METSFPISSHHGPDICTLTLERLHFFTETNKQTQGKEGTVASRSLNLHMACTKIRNTGTPEHPGTREHTRTLEQPGMMEHRNSGIPEQHRTPRTLKNPGK